MIAPSRDALSHFYASMSHVYPSKARANDEWLKLSTRKRRPYEEIAKEDFSRYHSELEAFYKSRCNDSQATFRSRVHRAKISLKERSLLQSCRARFSEWQEWCAHAETRRYAPEWRKLRSAILDAKPFLKRETAREMILTLSNASGGLIADRAETFTSCIANLASVLVKNDRDVLAEVLWRCAHIPCAEAVHWFSEHIGLVPLPNTPFTPENSPNPDISALVRLHQDAFRELAGVICDEWHFPTALKRIVFVEFLDWIA